MSSITSLYTAVSALQAAQRGLAVTGHNMSNSEINGYSRQRVIQTDFAYQTIGFNGKDTLKKGLGTNTLAIEQIRNQFLDHTDRKSTRLNSSH